jgi:hypothetical protein
MELFSIFPNQSHIGEIFTPKEYVIKTTNYLKQLIPPSKENIVIDPAAGLGQFEVFLQEYTVIANEIEVDNYNYIKSNINVDILNNIDSLEYEIPKNISAVVANPPYSGHINNKKAKREELWQHFVNKYFINSDIPIGIFIIPNKWMTTQYFNVIKPYLYLVDILDSKKFLLKESKWSTKLGVSARIMSGVSIVILSKTKPNKFTIVNENYNKIIDKSILKYILPVNRTLDIETSCKYIDEFVSFVNMYGSCKERFISQYWYQNHGKKIISDDIPIENIFQSRRKNMLNKDIDVQKFHKNTWYDDWKCILSTSNECWNGYIFNFPVFILKPEHIFTSNYFGFWGTEEECIIMKKFFESKEFNVLLSMIKQTQNFNSNYFWCIPLVTTKEQLEFIQSKMKYYTNFIATFEHEVRRPYNKK